MTPRYDINATAKRRMLSHLFALQNRANAAVDPQWLSRGNRWSRAILVEGVELLEHYGRWKWWKKQNAQPDLGQCRLELVDIWHFALSWYMERFGSTDAADWVLNEAVMRRIEHAEARAATLVASDEAFNTEVEALVGAAADGRFDADAFFALCAFVQMPFEALYGQYLGKNVLHVFRQHYGYKTGRYVKDWNGVEDNVVLEEVMAQHAGLAGEALEHAVRAALEVRYTEACTQGRWHCLELANGPFIGQLTQLGQDRALRSPQGGVQRLTDASTLRALPILES
jgi:hypothetical protein